MKNSIGIVSLLICFLLGTPADNTFAQMPLTSEPLALSQPSLYHIYAATDINSAERHHGHPIKVPARKIKTLNYNGASITNPLALERFWNVMNNSLLQEFQTLKKIELDLNPKGKIKAIEINGQSISKKALRYIQMKQKNNLSQFGAGKLIWIFQ